MTYIMKRLSPWFMTGAYTGQCHLSSQQTITHTCIKRAFQITQSSFRQNAAVAENVPQQPALSDGLHVHVGLMFPGLRVTWTGAMSGECFSEAADLVSAGCIDKDNWEVSCHMCCSPVVGEIC